MSCAGFVRDLCSCCQPRLEPGSVRVRRRSSHGRAISRRTDDGAGGGWSGAQWRPVSPSDALWDHPPAPRSSDESSSDSDANSSLAERLTKAWSTPKKKRKKKKRERHRRGAIDPEGKHAPLLGTQSPGTRARGSLNPPRVGADRPRGRRKSSPGEREGRARRGSADEVVGDPPKAVWAEPVAHIFLSFFACCLLLRLMRAVLTQPGDKPRRRRGSAGAALREERSRGLADEPEEPQPEARSLYSGTTPAERRDRERWRAGAVDVMGGHSQQLSKERRRRKSSDRVEQPRAPGGIQ